VATIFLDTNQQNFNVANDGDKVFGQQGTESVTILSGVTGVVLDANVDEIMTWWPQATFKPIQTEPC
jgi:hypothetical protein